jgi:hypothetical protein
MRISLFALTAVLVWPLTACSDGASPVESDSDGISTVEVGSVAAARASAGGRPIDATYTFDIEEGLFCDFAIRVEGAEKQKTISLPGDRTLLIFPGAVTTYTNLSNGTQETFRIPGSFHITTLENGDVEVVFTGRNIIGQPLPFEPRFLVLAIGTFTFVTNSQGDIVQQLQGSGQLIDICELLG